MLIGLHGQAQSGKDTVYERMVHLFPFERVERISFADRLYASAAAAIGTTPDVLRRYKTVPEARLVLHLPACHDMVHLDGISVREYLQLYGTEAHRGVFGDAFWVEAANVHNPADHIVAVTDVRFPNEAEHIRGLGGHIVAIHGPEADAPGIPGHASEAGLTDVDYILLNTERGDDFAALDEGIKRMVRVLNGRDLRAVAWGLKSDA